jgi:hypothetical protein
MMGLSAMYCARDVETVDVETADISISRSTILFVFILVAGMNTHPTARIESARIRTRIVDVFEWSFITISFHHRRESATDVPDLVVEDDSRLVSHRDCCS